MGVWWMGHVVGYVRIMLRNSLCIALKAIYGCESKGMIVMNECQWYIQKLHVVLQAMLKGRHLYQYLP